MVLGLLGSSLPANSDPGLTLSLGEVVEKALRSGLEAELARLKLKEAEARFHESEGAFDWTLLNSLRYNETRPALSRDYRLLGLSPTTSHTTTSTLALQKRMLWGTDVGLQVSLIRDEPEGAERDNLATVRITLVQPLLKGLIINETRHSDCRTRNCRYY